MSKTQAILTSVLLLLQLVGFAQITKSGPLIQEKAGYLPVFAGSDNENIYVISELKASVFIEAYERNSYSRIYRVNVSEPIFDGKKAELERVFYTGGTFVAIYISKSSLKETPKVYVRRFRATDGAAMEAEKLVLESKPTTRQTETRVLVHTSPDNTKIIIQSISTNAIENTFSQTIVIVDKELNVLLSDSNNSRVIDTNKDIILDNEGSVYNYYVEGNEFIIVSYDAFRDFEKWETIVPIDIPDQNEFLYKDTRIIFTKENNLILTAGVYLIPERSNGRDFNAIYSKLVGHIYATIDVNTKEVKQNVVEIYKDGESTDANGVPKKPIRMRFDGQMFYKAGLGVLIINNEVEKLTILPDYEPDPEKQTFKDVANSFVPIKYYLTFKGTSVRLLGEDGVLKWYRWIPANQEVRLKLGSSKTCNALDKRSGVEDDEIYYEYIRRHMGSNFVLGEDGMHIFTLEGINPNGEVNAETGRRQELTLRELSFTSLKKYTLNYQNGEVTKEDVCGHPESTFLAPRRLLIPKEGDLIFISALYEKFQFVEIKK